MRELLARIRFNRGMRSYGLVVQRVRWRRAWRVMCWLLHHF